MTLTSLSSRRVASTLASRTRTCSARRWALARERAGGARLVAPALIIPFAQDIVYSGVLRFLQIRVEPDYRIAQPEDYYPGKPIIQQEFFQRGPLVKWSLRLCEVRLFCLGTGETNPGSRWA
jgi:hypothetical protein